MLFVCPKCKQKLNITGNCAVCALGHSYDKNKKGFFNLFLSSKGGTHGDNRMMVESRRRFLDLGYYEPLARAVASAVCDNTPSGGTVLDIGCGEGYYTDFTERTVREKKSSASVFGFDISKEAIALAVRRNPNIEYAVAGAYDMPVADGSVNTAVNMFAPLAPSEIFRVLKQAGTFIMAIPAEEHLFGLKSVLYETPYKNTVQDTSLSGFSLIGDSTVKYPLNLTDKNAILSLFGMTPYAYRTGKAGIDRIEAVTFLKTDVHFRIFVYKKI